VIKLTTTIFINPEALAYVEFTPTDRETEAHLLFVAGEELTLQGVAATHLQNYLNALPLAWSETDSSATEISRAHPTHPTAPPPLELPFRKKAWFFCRDREGREVILALVNRGQSCSVRTFEANTGIFVTKLTGSGSYRDSFRDLLTRSVELTVPYQPNLDRNCKERLPGPILKHLRQQIKTFEFSSGLG
jgi:hypothetical protein